MRIAKKSNWIKKPSLVIAGVLLTAMIICLVYFYGLGGAFFGWSPIQKNVNTSGNNPASREQIENGDRIKQQSIDDGAKSSALSGSDQPMPPTEDPDGGKARVEMAITAANQTENSVQLRALIYGIDSNGACSLTLTKSESPTVRKTASVQNQSNTSTCMGFDVPLTELSKGSWSATITFSGDSIQGSTTKNITIN